MNTLSESEYFSGSRLEVASLVPNDVQNVLDVGCGFGGLGRALRSKGLERLYGIELNPSAPEYLRDVYDQFWIGDVENIQLPTTLESLDCIIFADVLEHLVDPWSALNKYSKLLKPGGVVVASIPNVQNLGLLYNLIFRGKWTYEDSGLLDRTHLRFFTRSVIQKLFQNSGLGIEIINVNLDRYSLVRRIITAIPRLFIPDLAVCQFIVRARKS